ncbi:MAG: hypothetical protein ABI406_03900, partial [Ktedonobacteraceae bacterium]
IPLTDSGHVLLTEEARFLVTKKTANQGTFTTGGPSPLDGHWPSLHLCAVDLRGQRPWLCNCIGKLYFLILNEHLA